MDPLLIIMVLAVGAMFLLTSRTRKQQRKSVEFRQSLEIGDEVMTGSGLFGTIVDIDGDVITLESPSGGRTDWLRAAISKLATPPWAPEEELEEVDDLEEGDEGVDEEAADPQDTLPAEANLDDLDERADANGSPRLGTAAPGDPAATRDAADGRRNGHDRP